MSYYNENTAFNPQKYIEEKIEMEVNSIGHYIKLTLLVCGYKMFDMFGDEVDENLFNYFIKYRDEFIIRHLKRIISNYYNTDEKKETSVKEIDKLLGYTLNETKSCIRNKSSLIKTGNPALEAMLFLKNSKYIWSKDEIGDIGGANYASDIFCGVNSNDIQRNICSIVDEYSELLKESLSNVEKHYYKYLLIKTIADKYKVTKNDFSDFLIVSAADFNTPDIIDDDIVVITYDKRLKGFLEDNNYYYDKDIYNLIYY